MRRKGATKSKPQDTRPVQKARVEEPNVDEQIMAITQGGEKKTNAIRWLDSSKDKLQDLAIKLWYSEATVPALLADLLEGYPRLINKTMDDPTQIIGAIKMFHIIASNESTRLPFMRSNIPLYLVPFMQSCVGSSENEFLCGASLAIFTALVKGDSQEVLQYFIDIELLALLIRIMRAYFVQNRAAATFLFSKILTVGDGEETLCVSQGRIIAAVKALWSNVGDLCTTFDTRLAFHTCQAITQILKMEKAAPIAKKIFQDTRSINLNNNELDKPFKEFISNLIK